MEQKITDYHHKVKETVMNKRDTALGKRGSFTLLFAITSCICLAYSTFREEPR